jgi:hypothetical protein
MAQRINVFDTELDISNLKVGITFVGDQMITAFEIQFETGPDDDDRSTLFMTTIYTGFPSFSDDAMQAATADSIRTGSERYKEWLDSVGGTILESDAAPEAVEPAKVWPSTAELIGL